MPKDKELTHLIPRMYKWNFENLSLFIWVRAQMSLIGTLTLDQAINNYIRYFDITPDDWDKPSIKSTYTRLQKEFFDKYEDTKTDNGHCKPQTGIH